MKPLFSVVLLAVLLGTVGCGSSNHLRDVDLADQPVAVLAAIPPHPRVQAGSPGEAAIDIFDPIGTVARVGTAAAKWRQARRAQARLDSVAQHLDVADRIARRAFIESGRRMGYRPVGSPDQAAYLLDLRLVDYGLVADSFEGALYFVVEGEVLFRDRLTGRLLWRTRLRERETVDRSLFYLPATVGNILTAEALADLSEADMQAGLERLADLTADRIALRLSDDYLDSRR